MGQRLSIIALLAVAVTIGLIWYTRTDHIQPLPSTPIEPRAKDPDGTRSRSRVHKVTRSERDALRDQIARAREANRHAGTGSTADRPDAPRALTAAHESADPAVRKFNERALEELGGTQAYLSECFDRHRKQLPDNLTVLTKLVVTTDPDIGAIIDAEALTDPDGKPLPTEFDACIRDMLQTFTLPPLPPTDDSQFLLALQLSFRDDDEADTLKP